MSTPHVSGLAADLVEARSAAWRAAQLKAFVIEGALDGISGGGIDMAGYGGVDFINTHTNGGTQYWTGPQSGWSSWDYAGAAPTGDSLIDVLVSVPANRNRVRVVLSWLTRGSWTYDHRNDTFPLGINLGMAVYNGSGVLAPKRYAAAYTRVGNVNEPPEVDFETHVVIAVELGEWGGCGQYLELMGARELEEVIEVDARFVHVNGDDGANWPYLFASAPRSEKPYEVVQRQPSCPAYRYGGSSKVYLQCRYEDTRLCAFGQYISGTEDMHACPEGSDWVNE